MLTTILGSLGIQGQLMTAAVLVLFALYIRRALALGAGVAGVASAGATYALVVLGAGAIAIAAGWVDPHPSTMVAHLRLAGSWVLESGIDFVKGPFEMLVNAVDVSISSPEGR